ncbi:uncharacterized protein FFUJ_10821 [Fusarium fujikuroi IMI 58289]|uniref:Uncharacterized protein n=1 Tax=Gibberella fujikuroi (strain CBS 195.34 / IMI 58289 / NRRL A-6831) TaxID=1279085 RepID=S0EJD6_GIBF5|nr:uncharacterized protein FFUJ_10821 [Fusarium fujikuroi IMI 58289]KLP17915.1 uncharacterized protein LW94_1443 [Fusarium fujikuroi]CCT74755.1 uncharacterized protein FFUJ_10821 [Fusarium fujikuroi IMI 58289]SCO04879.1 uncharacterized protein FFM5_08430 [Fusarium fujikuroi]SCO57903.1 uncharacterized protein FFMR_15059 [Fusarium fujikuroi]SCV47897.1 uncharacterized protein FFB14_10081 [Fusarium fujikuroi]
MGTLNLYLAVSKERGQGQPRHWILMLAEEDATHAIFYHITGGPMRGKPYEVTIEPKRVESHGIDRRHLIAQVLEKDRQKIKAAVRQAPPLFCQRWILNVFEGLEKQGVVPEGTCSKWNKALETDPFSGDGAPSKKPLGNGDTTDA